MSLKGRMAMLGIDHQHEGRVKASGISSMVLLTNSSSTIDHWARFR
jgi:hypothetical protein